MNDQEKIEKVQEYIRGHKLAVLSTVSRAVTPESAVVGFSELPGLVLIFGTFDSARKYRNLRENSKVSLVIGWEHGRTVQYEGEAWEITDSAEIEDCKRVHLAKIPSAAKYVSAAEEKFFKIKPSWVRYSDLSADPWEIWEIVF